MPSRVGNLIRARRLQKKCSGGCLQGARLRRETFPELASEPPSQPPLVRSPGVDGCRSGVESSPKWSGKSTQQNSGDNRPKSWNWSISWLRTETCNGFSPNDQCRHEEEDDKDTIFEIFLDDYVPAATRSLTKPSRSSAIGYGIHHRRDSGKQEDR